MAQRRPDRVRGPGHDDFWAWCNQGELRLQACKRCGHLAWPVVATCERCSSQQFAWRQMSGRGKVVSWCTFEYDYYRGALAVPYETILVELEEGPLFVSNPVGLTWRDLTFDMPVKLAFLECADATGTFKLPVFEKA